MKKKNNKKKSQHTQQQTETEKKKSNHLSELMRACGLINNANPPFRGALAGFQCTAAAPVLPPTEASSLGAKLRGEWPPRPPASSSSSSLCLLAEEKWLSVGHYLPPLRHAAPLSHKTSNQQPRHSNDSKYTRSNYTFLPNTARPGVS